MRRRKGTFKEGLRWEFNNIAPSPAHFAGYLVFPVTALSILSFIVGVL